MSPSGRNDSRFWDGFRALFGVPFRWNRPPSRPRFVETALAAEASTGTVRKVHPFVQRLVEVAPEEAGPQSSRDRQVTARGHFVATAAAPRPQPVPNQA